MTSPSEQPSAAEKTLWEELEGKLHEDGTYHVTQELMGSIILELENFRDLQQKGCIVPWSPSLSRIAVSYTKGDPVESPVVSSRKKAGD
jgi:hypothetical protein